MLQIALFVIIYLGGIGVALVRHPSVIFCVYQLVYFFNPKYRWWGYSLPDFSYSFPVAIVLLVLASVAFFRRDVVNSLNNPVLIGLFGFFTIFAFCTLNAVKVDAHVEQLIYFFQSLLIIFSAYVLLNNAKKVEWCINAYIFGAFYLSFYGYQLGRNSGGRLTGIAVLDSVDSNSVAVSLIPGFIFSLGYLVSSSNVVKKYYYGFSCLFIANCIVLINSRGAMLAIGLGALFLLVVVYKGGGAIRHAKKKALAIFILSISGAIYLADESSVQRFNTIFEESAENTEVQSGATRTYFWVAAFEMSKDYPLGLGFRGFNVYAPLYIPEEVNTGASRNRSVHSSWFEALTEVGYLGLAVLLYLIYKSFYLTNKAKEICVIIKDKSNYLILTSLQASLISTCVGMTFISRMRGETFFWLLLFSMSLYECLKRKYQEVEVK